MSTHRLRLAAAILWLAAAPQAFAQTGSLRNADVVTAKATVKSVDQATRHVVLTGDNGETFTVKAPPEVRNLDKLKAGDHIVASYRREVEVALSPVGAKAPKDDVGVAVARAPKGGVPAAGVGAQIQVTGAIVGIDKARHSVKLVNPQGGEVHDIVLASSAGRAALPKLKVGQKLTITVTESLLIAAKPG